ncbi:MAG: ABC transporter [Acidobacteriales bacterium 59-55]|nr:ATP-binding cassette domain-containing protein [Terriglobales bacterium]OJV41254.1 MAG: ABC transporter [Acidobacteriales bacterium 59-55]
MSEPTHLSLTMQHRQGTLAFDAAFELTRPWTVLFGPSGSGKTTVLRAIAGLMRPATGRIVLGFAPARVLFDRTEGIYMPAHRRGVRLAAQVATLFPNMTVQENIAYGVPPAAMEVVDETLQRFHLERLAETMPWKLSGGERQRTAVARAAASATTLGGSGLLLLDEPFAGLDLRLRDDLLRDLRSWLAETHTPVLSVTHDVGEAFQLGAEVIKFADGRVLQQGPVEAVLAEERERLLDQLSGGGVRKA